MGFPTLSTVSTAAADGVAVLSTAALKLELRPRFFGSPVEGLRIPALGNPCARAGASVRAVGTAWLHKPAVHGACASRLRALVAAAEA